MSSVVNEQDYITKKSTKTVSSSYAVAAYNTLFEVVFFLIYIIIFSSPILYWTKIAKSGMLYSLMSGDSKYCSPFINEGKPTDASYDKFLPNKHDDEYIATDKFSLWKKDVGLLTYGKVIKFDYNKNVIDSLGKMTFWKKLLFGFNVQYDYKKEESFVPLFDTYSGFGIYYTFARGLTLFNIKVINYIFLFLSWIPIPEAILYILPALAPLYVLGIFQYIFYILLMFNFAITCLYLIYQVFAIIFYYIGLLSDKVQQSGIDSWSTLKIVSVIFFWTVIFWLSILFVIFIILPISVLLVMGSLGIYGIFMMVLLAINPLALLFYIAYTFEANICDVTKKNDDGKWDILPNDKYNCLTLMKDNFRYKWNWIIFTITLIVLYNILKTYNVSGINILIVIVILYLVSWTIRNRLVDDDTSSNKNKFVTSSYSEDELREQNMTHIAKYNDIFKDDYNDNYECTNNEISNEMIDTPKPKPIPTPTPTPTPSSEPVENKGEDWFQTLTNNIHPSDSDAYKSSEPTSVPVSSTPATESTTPATESTTVSTTPSTESTTVSTTPSTESATVSTTPAAESTKPVSPKPRGLIRSIFGNSKNTKSPDSNVSDTNTSETPGIDSANPGSPKSRGLIHSMFGNSKNTKSPDSNASDTNTSETPGIDSNVKPIKKKSLSNRVTSYFQSKPQSSPDMSGNVSPPENVPPPDSAKQ
jgi:hypothetical protein